MRTVDPILTTPPSDDRKPLELKTWREVEEYFKKHLVPHRFGPKGQPIYRQVDIERLNVILPEDY